MVQTRKYNLYICNTKFYNSINYGEIRNHINDYFKNELQIQNYELSKNQIHNLIKNQNTNKRKVHPLLLNMFQITEI